MAEAADAAQLVQFSLRLRHADVGRDILFDPQPEFAFSLPYDSLREVGLWEI